MHFKNLEIADAEHIASFHLKNPCYSDYNFASLFSWDLRREIRIAGHDENLIIRFTDYLSGEPFYSFHGKDSANETAEYLLRISAEDNIVPVLKLVPEETALLLDSSKFEVAEDRDNFDYIYDVDLLSEYKGSEYSDKRNKAKSFLKNFPEMRVRELRLEDPDVAREVIGLNDEWLKRKIEKGFDIEVHNDLDAVANFFRLPPKGMTGTGIFNRDKLEGYALFEKLPGGFSLCHFSKVDIGYKSINDFFMRENARILKEQGVSFLNYEQDLGIPGTRYTKTSFRPKRFMKKFTVKLAPRG